MLKGSLVLHATALACPQSGVQRFGINAHDIILRMNVEMIPIFYQIIS